MTDLPVSQGSAELDERLRRALAPTYQLLRRLGKGGMGTVFLAREPSLKRLVAVKVLSPELTRDEEAHARFEREAQAVAALAHPNVVGIYGVGKLDDGTPYFVMQYVEGPSLAERIAASGQMPLREARRVIAEVASALAAAHAKGIIHRDIKPANVLQDEASGRVLVSDFGLATGGPPTPDAADMRLTQTGMRVGTPQYMSPEQLLTEEPTDRTDVYGLGLLAYEVIAGEGPFAAKSAAEIVAAHLRDEPPRLSTRRAEVDVELENVVAACLEKDAAKRPSAQQVADRLAPQGVSVLEWPPPGLEEWSGSAQPHARWLWWTGGMMTLALAAFLAFGMRLIDADSSGIGVLLVGVIVIGGIGLLLRLRLLLGDLLRAGKAVRAGYSWRTWLEVCSDARGDGGDLITGSRAYAGLEVGARRALRRLRVWSAVAGVVAPIAAPVLAVAWLFVGSRGAWSPTLVAALSLVPLLASLTMRLSLAIVERRSAGGATRARARLGKEMPALASLWYGSLDRSTGESVPRRGQRSWFGAAFAGLGLALAALLLFVLTPLMLIPWQGSWLVGLTAGNTAFALERVRLTERYSLLAPAVDASIAPSVAGRWLVELAQRADSLPAEPSAELVWASGRELSADERAYIALVAQQPIWPLYDSLSRAPAVDALGALTTLPLPDDATWAALPGVSSSGIRRLEAANRARVAHYALLGEHDAAQAALAAGFGFARALATQWEPYSIYSGASAARRAFADAESYTRAFPGVAEERLRVLVDSLRVIGSMAAVSNENVARQSPSATAIRADAIRDVRNPRLPTSLRLSQLQLLTVTQCASLREALFGPAPDLAAALQFARDSVARFESEREVVRLIAQEPPMQDATTWTSDATLLQVASRWLALSGSMLGAPRVRMCASMIGNRRLRG